MENTIQDLHGRSVATQLQYLLILAVIAASIFGAFRTIDLRIATTLNTVSAQVAAAGASAS